MKNEYKKRPGEYTFLAGHHLNPETEMILDIKPDNPEKMIGGMEIRLDEHEGVYNQNRLMLIYKSDLKNGIEFLKGIEGEIKMKNDDEKRSILISGKGATLLFKRTPYLFHPIIVRAERGRLSKDQRALYHISQLNRKGEAVGGVSVIFQGS